MLEWDDDIEDSDLRDATRTYLPRAVVWTTDWTTGSLIDQMERGLFNLEPPFQRRNVWSDKRASLYIESLLLGCPVPAITLAEMPEGNPYQYVVIDGKQRLTSLKRFAADKTLRLTGLDVLDRFTGTLFDDLKEEPEFQRFENLPIRTVIVRSWEKDEVLHFIFHRLNSQVTPLSSHELRRSLIPGPFTDYLDRRSAESAQLHRILNIDGPDYRLRDAELLLRGIAFLEFLPKYRGNLKQFLDDTTRNLNISWTAETESHINASVHSMEQSIDATYQIFGKHSFQRFQQGKPVGRFNRAVFDTHIIMFSNESVRNASVAERDGVKSAFIELFNDAEISPFFEATTKTRAAVFGRLEAWATLLGQAIGVEIEMPSGASAR